MPRSVVELIELLRHAKIDQEEQVFNPWAKMDERYDLSPRAPEMRRENLLQFLRERRGQARFILMGEAIGYQGGKFSGIAMMSERILGGRKIPHFPREGYHPRTSDPGHPKISSVVAQYGFNEPTATTVWEAILKNGVAPISVVTWNIFPFHPYRIGDTLSNRARTDAEIERYLGISRELRALFPEATVLAVGQKAARYLGSKVITLRHPAYGGAEVFRGELERVIRS